MITIVVDDVSCTASDPAVEGSQLGRIHLLNGNVLYLVVGGSSVPLAAHVRALNILLLLLLNSPVAPPPP